MDLPRENLGLGSVEPRGVELLTSEDSSEWKVTDSWPDTFTQGLFRMLGGGRAGPGAAGWVTWPVEGALGGHRGLDTEAVQLKQSQLRLSA